MKIFWEQTIESTATLYYHEDRRMFPHRLAVVTRVYGGTPYQFIEQWKARVIVTLEEQVFPTEDQAKDWAQAVVLLNQ
jgi:hypothetical protein